MNLTELCQLPDTREGCAARRVLWSLWNQHRSVNLGNEVGSLSYMARVELGALITASLEGREAGIRKIFHEAGECERIEQWPIGGNDHPQPTQTNEAGDRPDAAGSTVTRPTKLTYGDGNLNTYQGKLVNGNRCICIVKHDQGRPIGYVPRYWEKVMDESEMDVILEFKNIESSRTLQDELGELIAIWSREHGLTLPESNRSL